MYLKQMQYSSLSFHVPTGKSQNKVKYPSQPVCIETICKSLYVTIKIKQIILCTENTCKSLFEHSPFCALRVEPLFVAVYVLIHLGPMQIRKSRCNIRLTLCIETTGKPLCLKY